MSHEHQVKVRGQSHFVDGEFVDSSSDERIGVRDPATEEHLGSIPAGTSADVELAVEAAERSFMAGSWRRRGVRERSRIVRRVGELMLERADELAITETTDQGRPIRQSRGMQVPLAAAAWDFFAGALMGWSGHSIPPDPAVIGFTFKQPVGVVACITPGNVPLVLASEKLAPALAAGNSVILKPPSECPLSSILLAECIAEAGVPDGVFNLLLGDAEPVGTALVEHPAVNMVAFTGSTETGKRIMAAASGTVKRLLLELGGKAPMVVCADADVDAAVEGALWASFMNGGQVCMSATRILLHESVYQPFAERFVARTEALRIGPGIDTATDLGPMVTRTARDRVRRYVEAGLSDGATLLTGGEPLEGERWEKGFWVRPAVFTDVTPDMSIVHEEIFGPVPVLERFADLDDAVERANDTRYGLTGSVWTRDLETGLRLAEEIQAGYVWINDHLVRAPNLPFGGWKESGIGRETAALTLDEFAETKSIHVDRTGVARKPRYELLSPDTDV